MKINLGDILYTDTFPRKLIVATAAQAKAFNAGNKAYIGAIRDDVWVAHRSGHLEIGTSAAYVRLGASEEADAHKAKVEAFIRAQHPTYPADQPLWGLTGSYGYRIDIEGSIKAGKAQ
jgi:hypothetical protein